MFEIGSPFTMVVIIVAIGCTAGVITSWLDTKEKQKNRGPSAAELKRMEDLEREVARLRERVKVLETITTDGDHDLRQQISRLA